MTSSAIGIPISQAKTQNIQNASQQLLSVILSATESVVFKANPTAPCLKKVVLAGQDTSKANNSQVQIAAGTYIRVGEILVSFATDTLVDSSWVAGAAIGTDWAVFVKSDGTTSVVDVTNEDVTTLFAPRTIGGLQASLVGGFHFGLTTETMTLNFNPAGKQVLAWNGTAHALVTRNAFSTTNAERRPIAAPDTSTWQGEIWTQALLNRVKCVNTDSFWDVKFRPGAIDPRGFFNIGKTWIGIYPASVNCGTGTNGNKYRVSKYFSGLSPTVASGAAIPTNPLTGVVYPSFNAWDAGDLMLRCGCRLPTNAEFSTAAAGVTEGVSFDDNSTAPTSSPAMQFLASYPHGTSLCGGHGMTGFQWVWGQEQRNRTVASATFAWYNASTATDSTKGRGSVYDNADDNMAQILLGGDRYGGAGVGSRCSAWTVSPRNSYWAFGVRAACDHL